MGMLFCAVIGLFKCVVSNTSEDKRHEINEVSLQL